MLHLRSGKGFLMNIGIPFIALGLSLFISVLVMGPFNFILDPDLATGIKYVLPWLSKTLLIYSIISVIIGGMLILISLKIKNKLRTISHSSWFIGFKAISVILLTNIIMISVCGIIMLNAFNIQ
jgi:hypothetical protein